MREDLSTHVWSILDHNPPLGCPPTPQSVLQTRRAYGTTVLPNYSETTSCLTQAFEGEMSSWRYKIQIESGLSLQGHNSPKPHTSLLLGKVWRDQWSRPSSAMKEHATRKEKADGEKVTWRPSSSQEAQFFVSLRLLCIFTISRFTGCLITYNQMPSDQYILHHNDWNDGSSTKVSHLVNSNFSRKEPWIPMPRSSVTC